MIVQLSQNPPEATEEHSKSVEFPQNPTDIEEAFQCSSQVRIVFDTPCTVLHIFGVYTFNVSFPSHCSEAFQHEAL
ncbi:hypothetical protein CEXT_65741 [Caerostris extrusa]|uniref:Uncharacterized protein n=1 Tax=Caerostris extrusa TaxID=172846 RepID=A0AAV4SB43_CAEEX|nr:hypothetical protein CEXT_65741 [Caerostris extrusa]